MKKGGAIRSTTFRFGEWFWDFGYNSTNYYVHSFEEVVVLTLEKKYPMLLLMPLFKLVVNFNVFASNIMRLLRPWLQKVVILM